MDRPSRRELSRREACPVVDADRIWDAEADPVVASILDRGLAAEVNRRLRTWTHNDQPVPDGLPEELRAFLERARRLPPWADRSALDRAAEFIAARDIVLNLAHGLGSGLVRAAVADHARAIARAPRGVRTGPPPYLLEARDAYAPDGRMVIAAVKTRLAHAAIRHLLPRAAQWHQDIPLSQRDLLITWHTLPTFAMRKLSQWRISVTPRESDAYLHAWRVTAHLLGIRDELVPESWEAAHTQSARLLEPVLRSTPAGIELADTLLDRLAQPTSPRGLSRPLANALGRYIVGDQIADWDGIAREPFWDPVVHTTFPALVARHEGNAPRPRIPQIAWVVDEAVRQHVRAHLARARTVDIEIPDHVTPASPGGQPCALAPSPTSA